MTPQDQQALAFTNQLVRALGNEFSFGSLPHGQSQGWVTCTILLRGTTFQVTRFDDGRVTVVAVDKNFRITSLNVSADQYAAHLEAALSGRLSLS